MARNPNRNQEVSEKLGFLCTVILKNVSQQERKKRKEKRRKKNQRLKLLKINNYFKKKVFKVSFEGNNR